MTSSMLASLPIASPEPAGMKAFSEDISIVRCMRRPAMSIAPWPENDIGFGIPPPLIVTAMSTCAPRVWELASAAAATASRPPPASDPPPHPEAATAAATRQIPVRAIMLRGLPLFVERERREDRVGRDQCGALE